jgi:hypothetical protein
MDGTAHTALDMVRVRVRGVVTEFADELVVAR